MLHLASVSALIFMKQEKKTWWARWRSSRGRFWIQCFVWASAKLCVFQHVLPPHRLNTMWNEAVNRVYFPLVLKSLFMLLLCVFMTCVYTDRAWCLYEKHDSLRTRRKNSTLANSRRCLFSTHHLLSLCTVYFLLLQNQTWIQQSWWRDTFNVPAGITVLPINSAHPLQSQPKQATDAKISRSSAG